LDIKILYNDADLVVCVKPQGIISQSDSSGKNNMVSLLEEMLESTIFPVHRLDKETGGLMVFAKTKKAAADLSNQITDGRFSKEYLALVHNNVSPNSAVLKDLLFRDKSKNKSYVVKRVRKGVKEAELYYEKISHIVRDDGEFSLLRIVLKTGRTHQIRVQFASRGHSLLGDKRYGGRDDSKNLALWASCIKFSHPITKEICEFSATPDNTPAFQEFNLEL